MQSLSWVSFDTESKLNLKTGTTRVWARTSPLANTTSPAYVTSAAFPLGRLMQAFTVNFFTLLICLAVNVIWSVALMSMIHSTVWITAKEKNTLPVKLCSNSSFVSYEGVLAEFCCDFGTALTVALPIAELRIVLHLMNWIPQWTLLLVQQPWCHIPCHSFYCCYPFDSSKTSFVEIIWT